YRDSNEDRFYASMSVDPSVAKDICHPDWELTNEFIMDKRPLCHSFIDHLVTPGQFSCLVSLTHEDVEMSRLRLGFKGTKREVGRLRKQVEELKVEAVKVLGLLALYSQKEMNQSTLNDARLDKMVKETDEEFAPMLKDARETKFFIIWKDGMGQGLEVRFVHGKKGTDINSIPAYNPNAMEFYADSLSALNNVTFPLLEQIEACTE
ncbi:hypothetical protein Tco_0055506, partial [Tanacetum coccineum]